MVRIKNDLENEWSSNLFASFVSTQRVYDDEEVQSLQCNFFFLLLAVLLCVCVRKHIITTFRNTYNIDKIYYLIFVLDGFAWRDDV